MHNADMNDTLGNLVHRATNLCQKFCGGVIPDVPVSDVLPIDLPKLLASAATAMKSYQLHTVADLAISAFRDINKYLTEQAPWKMKGDEMDGARKTAVRTTLESIYVCTHLLIPFIPEAAGEIFRRLDAEPVCLDVLKGDLVNLKVGSVITVGDVLFTKVVSDEERTMEEAKKKKADDLAAAQKKKKAAKAEANKKAVENQGGGAEGDPDQKDFTKVDIRVGKITKVSSFAHAPHTYVNKGSILLRRKLHASLALRFFVHSPF